MVAFYEATHYGDLMTRTGMRVVDTAGAPEAWGMARSKTVTWWDPAVTASISVGRTGLEFMQALVAGEGPPAPIGMLMGMYPVEVELVATASSN